MQTTSLALGIDLGAKNTGLVILRPLADGTSSTTRYAIEGHLVEIDQHNFKANQVARRQRRHQRRNIKRRRLAKRLFDLILRDHFNFNVHNASVELREFLRGLFNRRGYSFLDVNSESADSVDPLVVFTVMQFAINSLDGGAFNMGDQEGNDYGEAVRACFAKLGDNPPLVNRLCDFLFPIKSDLLGRKKRSAGSAVIEQKSAAQVDFERWFNSLQEEGKAEALKVVLGTLESMSDALRTGAKPRSVYLKEINAAIAAPESPLHQLFSSTNLTPVKLANLIGNISNLQLRVLRRYFNQINPNQRLDLSRLARTLHRYIKSWRVEVSAKAAYHRLWQSLKLHRENIIEFILNTEPQLTIPPFEDQNNRRTPRCQSFVLNEAAVSRVLPNWETVVLAYRTKYPHLLMEARIQNSDVSSRLLLLQRILDLSRAVAPIALRDLVGAKERKGLDPEIWNREIDSILLTSGLMLSREQLNCLISLAAEYYQECTEAALASWHATTDATSVLKICDKKTRAKRNELGSLLANIFGAAQPLEATHVDYIKQALLSRKIERKSLRGILDDCNEFLKANNDYGAIRREIYLVERAEPANSPNKKLSALLGYVKKTGAELEKLLADCGFKISADRFNNIFTLSQLNTHLFKEVGGYAACCSSCNRENASRNAVVKNSEEMTAVAKRLPAQPVRPISGVILRLLEKTAITISDILRPTLQGNKNLDLLLCVEKNSFSWKQEASQFSDTGLRKESKIFSLNTSTKIDRIREDSCGVCPYTGQRLLPGYEQIDHIIPRSMSLAVNGSVINAEANLIYSSEYGNATVKGNRLLTLADLAPEYLSAAFGVGGGESAISAIGDVLGSMPEKPLAKPSEERPKARDFSFLNKEERQAVRHALFVPAFRERIIKIWCTGGITSRVNGTQNYFCSKLVELLNRRLKINVNLVVVPVNAYENSEFREFLAEKNLCEIKNAESGGQALASHITDAACAMILGVHSAVPRVAGPARHRLIASFKQLLTELSDNDLKGILVPEELNITKTRARSLARVTNQGSKAIFKASLYAKKFLPLIICRNGTTGIGFSPNNMVAFNPPPAFLEKLRVFIKSKKFQDIRAVPSILSPSQKEFVGLTWNKSLILKILSPKSPVEQDLVEFFECISYSTEKIPVVQEINKKLEVYQPQVKELNIQFKGAKEFGLVPGNIRLPVSATWNELRSLLKPVDDGKWPERLRRFFKIGMKRKLRQPARKLFSLPIKSEPSGGMFIKSLNRSTGQDVWRLAACEGQIRGFSLVDGVLRRAPLLNSRRNFYLEKELNLDQRLAHKGRLLSIGEVIEVTNCFGDNLLPTERIQIEITQSDRCDLLLHLDSNRFSPAPFNYLRSKLRTATVKTEQVVELSELEKGMDSLLDALGANPRKDKGIWSYKISKVNKAGAIFTVSVSLSKKLKDALISSL